MFRNEVTNLIADFLFVLSQTIFGILFFLVAIVFQSIVFVVTFTYHLVYDNFKCDARSSHEVLFSNTSMKPVFVLLLYVIFQTCIGVYSLGEVAPAVPTLFFGYWVINTPPYVLYMIAKNKECKSDVDRNIILTFAVMALINFLASPVVGMHLWWRIYLVAFFLTALRIAIIKIATSMNEIGHIFYEQWTIPSYIFIFWTFLAGPTPMVVTMIVAIVVGFLPLASIIYSFWSYNNKSSQLA